MLGDVSKSRNFNKMTRDVLKSSSRKGDDHADFWTNLTLFFVDAYQADSVRFGILPRSSSLPSL